MLALKRYKHVSQPINSISNTSSLVLHIFFILFALSCVIPFWLVISISFTDEAVIAQEGYQFFPKVFSLEGYQYLLKNTNTMLNAYKITILSTVVGTVLNVLTVALYAYPLSRPDFPYSKFFTNFVLVTMLFSGGLVPTYIINITVLHLKNTFWALVLPSLGAGFNVFITRTYFKESIPFELIEAANIDGASENQIFKKIIIPLSVPVLAVNALMSTFGFWNNWTNSLYYISDEKLYTLQYVMQAALRNLQILSSNEMQIDISALEGMRRTVPEESVRMARVLLGVGPIIIVYPFFQKYFIKGLTVGAVKG